jgi:hypothetical protein
MKEIKTEERKMSKNLLCLMTGLLAAVLLVGCLAPPEEPEQEWKWYENEELGFKIKYPANWEYSVKINKGESGVYFRPSVEEEERDAFTIMILEAAGLSLEGETNTIIDAFGILFGQPLEMLEHKNTTLGGEPAIKLVFKVEKGKGCVTEDCKGLIINAIKGDKSYTTIYSSLWKNYDKRIKISNEMVNSFEFI